MFTTSTCVNLILTLRTQVLPPANGKKLWRVRRSVSTGNPASSDSNLSLECLNNSLRISAAGKQFMARRPPLKRPKSKPGMPKDFVFVDLSPVKSSEEEEVVSSVTSSASSSPTLATSISLSDKQSPLSLNESFSCSEDELYPNFNYSSAPMFDDSALLGLGLMNINYDTFQPQQDEMALQMQHEQLAFQRFLQYQSQFTQPAQMAPQAQQETHKRSKSSPTIPRRKSAGGFQFKTYKGPNTSVRKPLKKAHRRCASEPLQKLELSEISIPQYPQTPRNEPGLEDFLHMPKMDTMDAMNLMYIAYTPLSDLSENDDIDALQKPINLDMMGCQGSQFLFKDEFDLSLFVSI